MQGERIHGLGCGVGPMTVFIIIRSSACAFYSCYSRVRACVRRLSPFLLRLLRSSDLSGYLAELSIYSYADFYDGIFTVPSRTLARSGSPTTRSPASIETNFIRGDYRNARSHRIEISLVSRFTSALSRSNDIGKVLINFINIIPPSRSAFVKLYYLLPRV